MTIDIAAIEELIGAVTRLKQALADAVARIQALEAHQTSFVGGNPSDSHEEQTEATVKATAAIVVTPPTITSKTTTNTDQPTGLGSEAEWERQWALHAKRQANP